MKKTAFFLLIVVMLLGGMLSCKNDDDDEDTLTGRSIKLTETDVTLVFGDEVNNAKQLKTVVSPAGSAVSWTTSNDKIVVVTPTGYIVANAIGYAAITASTGTAFATAVVHVKEKKSANANTEVTFDESVENGAISLEKGKTKTVSVTLAETTDTIAEWKSADPRKVTVVGNGNSCTIKGIAATETAVEITLTTSSKILLDTTLSVTVTETAESEPSEP